MTTVWLSLAETFADVRFTTFWLAGFCCHATSTARRTVSRFTPAAFAASRIDAPARTRSTAAATLSGDAFGRPNGFPSRLARSSPAFVRSMSRVRSCSATQPAGHHSCTVRNGVQQIAVVSF
jgi:hypothetical protein